MNVSRCVVLLLLVVATVGATAQDSPRPNIIVVMADDLGYGDVGANGATRIATPHLDRMAREGMNMTSFYASANVCTPSRAGLLTGRYPVRMGLAKGVVFPKNPGGLLPEEITIAEVLGEDGYRTGMIGKWHLGNQPPYWPTSAGFQSFFGVPYSNDMTPFPLYRDEEKIEEEVDQRFITERYAKAAVDFIETDGDKPFFLYLAHTMPHIPLLVSEKFEGKSEASLYGDVVETIDWSMGQIFEALKRKGIDDSTLVIFTSDNGPWYEGSSGRFRNRKGASWEGGQRVPFFARWPGHIAGGQTNAAISMNIDLLPTLAKLAGATLAGDHTVDGKNVLPLWQGATSSPHEVLYLFNENKIAAVRTPEWKFVVESYYKNYNPSFRPKRNFYSPGMLFNMRNDPEELYSMTRDFPEVVARLDALYEAGVKELVTPNKDFDARNGVPR